MFDVSFHSTHSSYFKICIGVGGGINEDVPWSEVRDGNVSREVAINKRDTDDHKHHCITSVNLLWICPDHHCSCHTLVESNLMSMRHGRLQRIFLLTFILQSF